MNTKVTRHLLLLALSAITATALVGCSSQDVAINYEEELMKRDTQIAELREQAEQNQAALKMSRREAEEAARRAAAAENRPMPELPADMDTEMLPPNAQPGECYARVLIPPVYESTTEEMLVKEASETIAIQPAEFEWVEETVLVKEAGEKLIVVPATYKTVTERLLVKDESTRMVEVPAVYETQTEKVLVTPAREYWKKGRGPIQKMDGTTGEIMCLVSEPAVYKNVTKKVLKTAATTREEIVPAEYETVTKTVIDQASYTRAEVIPAEYGTIKVRKLVKDAQEIRNHVDAEYRTVAKRVMIEPSYMEWRPILCETNINEASVSDIQRALKNKGFDPGVIDGIYGVNTRAAVKAFQQSKGLATGSLTIETVDALGLDL